MTRFAQLIIGPAGSGKTTYCHTIQQHYLDNCRRTVHVVNLDPANEEMKYEPLADIRSLVQLEDVMEDEELKLGPNGGLVYCMQFLADNLDWLDDSVIDESGDNDYFIFDCPGQTELFTHLDVMQRVVHHLTQRDFRIIAVFVLDAHFMVDAADYISAIFLATSTMACLQDLPFINIMTRIDLLSQKQKNDLDHILEPDFDALKYEAANILHKFNPNLQNLNEQMCSVMEFNSMVHFRPFDMSNPDSVHDIVAELDMIMQYEDEAEVPERTRDQTEDVLCDDKNR